MGDMRDNNVEEVGIEHGTFSYNARCYIHYTMAAYPVLTISGSRSYPKTVLAYIVYNFFFSIDLI
jgi:hypothetical protein